MMKRFGLPVALLVIFAMTRLPWLMPPNFSAVYAIAFCAGVYFPGRQAWWVPFTLIFASDCLLDLHYWLDLGINPFGISMLLSRMANYAAFAAIIALGRCFKKNTPWVGLVGGGLLSAVIFYLVTNCMSWLALKDYPKTLAGLVQALTIGLPGWPHTWEFFRNTLTSSGLFAGLFTAAMKVREKLETAPEAEEAEAEESEERPEGAMSPGNVPAEHAE